MDLICLLFFILGIIVGMIILKIITNSRIVTGVVQIDHETGLCRFKITNETLSNPKCQRVIFDVQHDAKISDEDCENSQQKQRL